MVAVDGFSSWGEEEDLDMDMHSPTDVSEDSVDVKVKPVNAPSLKSKRKCAEPRKFSEDVKKRRLQDEERSPFRPWSQETPSGYVPRGYAPPPADQDEPLSLVLREKPGDRQEKLAPPPSVLSDNHAKSMPRPLLPPSLVDRLHPDISSRPRPQDVVRLPYVEKPLSIKSETSDNYLDEDRNRAFSVESLMSTPSTSAAPTVKLSEKKRPAAPSTCASSASGVQNQQRNYKNMTRERRIEANARERTRVHTISAAFDTLRRAVPAYSHNQKLSKLSVLRIACSYILTLSRVAGLDYSEDSSEPPLADCVDHVTRTIQLEGKLRKKKDD